MNVENTKFNGEHQEVASGHSGPSATLIGLGLVIVLFVVFFFQNSKTVKINFLFFEKDTTIRWSLVVAVVLGIAADRIFSIWWRRRARRNNEA
jgi:uncharacterized integral membrane protein